MQLIYMYILGILGERYIMFFTKTQFTRILILKLNFIQKTLNTKIVTNK